MDFCKELYVAVVILSFVWSFRDQQTRPRAMLTVATPAQHTSKQNCLPHVPSRSSPTGHSRSHIARRRRHTSSRRRRG